MRLRPIQLLALAVLLAAPAAGAGPRLVQPDGAGGSGRVTLSLAPLQPGDPDDSLRLEAVVHGPLAGDGADDLYAFNAVLAWPAGRLAYVPGSVRKGELLGGDGRDWLITAAPAPGGEPRLTVGGSRMGAVPGLAAPAGPRSLFSVAVRVLEAGPVPLSWQEAAFIDSRVRPLDVARFDDATLMPAAADAASPEETP